MTDEQLLLFAKEEGLTLTPEALLILRNEFKSRDIDQAILEDIGDGTLLQERNQVSNVENLVHAQFNTSMLSHAMNETRDGKSKDEIWSGLLESGLPEEQAALLISQVEPAAKKLLSNATTSLLIGIFICLAGMAIHLINPSRFDISPVEILANCAILIGAFKIIKGVIDRKKYLTVLANLKNN